MDQPTMTQQQATERVEQILRETAAALSPQPRLELYEPGSQPHSCLDPSDGGSEDRVVVPRSYWLRDIPKERNSDIAQQVKRFWEERGHLITSTRGLDTEKPGISGRTRPDDFLISLEWSSDGSLSIGATSPCIWPNGTPEPNPTP